MQRADQERHGRATATGRALLERARGGDVAAYDAVVASRLPSAYQLARAILGTDVDADEAASCALVAAWHELPRLDDLDRFDDWLDRIVISECRMRLGGSGSAGTERAMAADLAERTMAVVRERPRRARRGDHRRAALLGLAFAVPVLLVALLVISGSGGIAALGGLLSGQSASTASPAVDPGVGGLVGGPSGGPSPSAATPPSSGESPAPAPPKGLAPGALAAVTLDGNNLRVRTTPGVGNPATRLKPLLPAGTRMLIVDGPVLVDGLEWFEVQTDGELIDLFGWVASGDNGESWISRVAPRCWGELGAATVAGLDRIDFLACYGRAEVKVRARAAGLWDVRARDGDCGWLRQNGACDVDNAWLLLPAALVTVVTDNGDEHDVTLAMPPDLSEALIKLPRQSTLLLTVSMDAPEAAACRARDADTGTGLIPDDRAITRCRLQFVVQEVAFRDPAAAPSDEPPN
ncbi:MAG TPA: hypothetical protein VES19_05105 [Candidatus Limnocylindrales bacterium]|nr:hypothetical protein [Candidatus Limnocylindrales bacterium]